MVLFLLPTQKVHAGGWLDGIVNIGYSAVVSLFAYSAYVIFTLVGKSISVLATLLQMSINIPVYPSGGIAVIDESWKIMRNFSNMFL